MSSELFGILFKQKLNKELVEIETKRKTVLKKSVIFVSGGIVIFFLCQIFNQSLGLLVIPFGLFSIFMIQQGYDQVQKWRRGFKKNIIPKVLQILDSNLELQDSNNFDRTIVRKSMLIQGYYEGIDVFCDDYITSKVYGNLKVAELEISRTEGKDSIKIFQGLLFSAQFPIQFYGKSYGFHKSIGGTRNLVGLEKVILESPRLMEKFNFYSTNQVEARMCFQTDIMSNLLDLCEQYGTNFDLSFIDNTIYIALHQNNGFFEPNIFQSVLDPKIYQKFYDEITTLNQIITKFKLHQNL